jgi:hypothetical protein
MMRPRDRLGQGARGAQHALMRAVNRQENPSPPKPPAMRRSVRLGLPQLIGIPLLLCIPILALAGVFGETDKRIRIEGNRLDVAAVVPARYRHGQTLHIQITIADRTGAALQEVRVFLDSAYLSRFEHIAVMPDPVTPYSIELHDVHQSAVSINLEMSASRWGVHHGEFVVTGSGDTIRLPLSTRVFP